MVVGCLIRWVSVVEFMKGLGEKKHRSESSSSGFHSQKVAIWLRDHDKPIFQLVYTCIYSFTTITGGLFQLRSLIKCTMDKTRLVGRWNKME